MAPFAIALHGGAGTILRSTMTPEKEQEYRQELENALQAGHIILKQGGNALDAVTETVRMLEDCPLFNAGCGSVFTKEGKHEMDASVMYGKKLEAGAVSGVRSVRNPVLLARAILEHSDHVFLYGDGAEELARKQKLAFEPEEYFFTKHRYEQWMEVRDSNVFILDHTETAAEDKIGTVGAVALDQAGNLAAATSTGGMTNKNFRRIGDTPVIGSGTYANNATCAVSCTGHGEYFLRAVVAYDVSCLMEYKGLSLKEACELVVHEKLVSLGGEGGLIAIDRNGNIELPFNSDGMYRACQLNDEEPYIGIYK